MSSPAATANQNPRNPFPGWRLANGVINATADQLEAASDSCENWAWGFAVFVVVGVAAEVIIAICHPPYESLAFRWGSTVTDVMIAAGIAGEIIFARRGHRIDRELNRHSNERAGKLEKEAAEARAETERLKVQLAPRMLNQKQIDLIESLKGKFPAINLGYETDAEAWWFATELRRAFIFNGINCVMLSRDPSVHSFSVMIYESGGFERASPKTVGPLIELFKDHQTYGAAAVISSLPTDILRHAQGNSELLATLDEAPMIVIGGRFIVPPDHWPKPPKMM